MNNKLKVSFVGVDQSPAIIAQAQQIMTHHFWVSHKDFFTTARLTVSKATTRGRGKTELNFDIFLPLLKCGTNQEVKVSKKGTVGKAHATLSILFRSAGDALTAKTQEVKTHHRGGKAALLSSPALAA